MRIGEEAHVEDEIGVDGQTVFEAERGDGHQQAGPRVGGCVCAGASVAARIAARAAKATPMKLRASIFASRQAL